MATNRCAHWHGDPLAECGRTDRVRHYLPGWRCPDHTPAALAGDPEPPPTGRPWWIREDGTHLPLPPLPAVPKGRDKPQTKTQPAPPKAEPAPVEPPARTGPPCCGKKPPGQAGQPVVNACKLCPNSPTYWRKT